MFISLHRTPLPLFLDVVGIKVESLDPRVLNISLIITLTSVETHAMHGFFSIDKYIHMIF